jgi:DNA-binding transcriptional ArsR family regulator
METTNGVCEQHAIDEDRVAFVRARMKPASAFGLLAELFAAMGDPTRVRLIYALAQEELCVCDLAAVLGLSVSAVSHQLRLLRGLRLVKYRREGRLAYYSLDDAHVYALLSQGMEHVEDREPPPRGDFRYRDSEGTGLTAESAENAEGDREGKRRRLELSEALTHPHPSGSFSAPSAISAMNSSAPRSEIRDPKSQGREGR